MPGSTHVPQLALQHSSPGLQTAAPHFTMGTTGSGRMERVVSVLVVVVVSSGRASTDGQTCCVHIMPGLTQTPQEGLQHVKPAAQTVVPHLTTPGMVLGRGVKMGTHRALPSMTAQVVVLVHLTVAQGVMVVVAASKLTGVLWTTPRLLARTASRRALVDLGKPAMVRE